jgi:ribosomal protein S18 acetylase RimI-like enzyme
MTTLTIRLATPADLAAILQIKPGIKREAVQRRIERTRQGQAAYWLAESGGRLLGHVFLKFDGKPTANNYPDIEDLYVRPNFRGQGIGTALLKRCEATARGRGFAAIGLSVGADNDHARELYRRLGYVDVSQEPYVGGVYDGEKEWVIDMKKRFK